MKKLDLDKFIEIQNKKINLFTPGPTSLSKENILGLMPCFGRGDKTYKILEKKIIKNIKKISGQKELIHFQGSGSLALEIFCLNFLRGKVLIVSSGFYSDRLFNMSKNAKKIYKNITSIDVIDWKEINSVKKMIGFGHVT